MASYLIIDTIRTDCGPSGSRSGSHVSSVVLDRGGAYLVTDIYDFMDHGHSFATADRRAGGRTAVLTEPASRMRCRHCGRPTLRLAVDPSTASEPDQGLDRAGVRAGAQPPTLPSTATATSRRRRGSPVVQQMDTASTI